MKSYERFQEIQAELKRVDVDMPGVIRAMAPAMSIGELNDLRAVVAGIAATLDKEHVAKIAPAYGRGRVETRGSKGTPELSERLR
jgi:hypothetical protein